MSHFLSELAAIPSGVQHAAEVLARLDQCFNTGFGRMSEREVNAVTSLPRLFSSTPLGPKVKEACDALLRSEFVEKHFASLACARAALQGSMSDALLQQAKTALGRSPSTDEPELSDGVSPGHHGVFRESTRHFLMEVALTGFAQLEAESVYPFYATLDKIQEEPGLVRLAAVLSGFLSELLSELPIPTGETIPIYRWVDLWTRAMLLSLSAPPAPKTEKVSGEFVPLGSDVRHHRNVFSVCVYGFLRDGTSQRFVQTTVSAFKVDTVIGHEMWRLLEGHCDKLLKGLRDGAMWKVADLDLCENGDLVWDESRVTVAGKSNPFDVAETALGAGKAVVCGKRSGLDRHPAMIAEPVFLSSYKTVKHETHKSQRASIGETLEEQALDLSGSKLPLSGARVSEYAGITLDRVAKSSAMIGLLRFDKGRWAIQPLALKQGNAAELSGTPPQTLKAKDDTVGVLRERASKLLRKKS